MAGLFITMEGSDGAGKTTQIEKLKDYLSNKGYDIILCREPGGTIISEEIRKVILNKDFTEMGYMTELLLYASARAQLVEQVIRPALREDKVVICDRFVDSSAVYQGVARGLGVDLVYEVNRYAIGDTFPDITILLDISGEMGIKRKKNQGELDRMELEEAAFHDKVSAGYRILAEKFPDRIKKIDATNKIDEIHDQIIAAITELIQGK
ncbi:MAG: dTMP kinase [Lachnospiraceae bacterium]|nr:dTMP kinase [Lachnospiraceae bacterium]